MAGGRNLASAYRRLFRIEHALMLAVAVFLAELLASNETIAASPAISWSVQPAFTFIPLPLSALLASLAVPVFIEMGSFALNDYFDVRTDKANKRDDRPIASGEISPRAALFAAVLCYAIGIAAAIPLPPSALAITAVFAILSIAYNFRLKELPLIGNAYIAASMAIPFIFGNLVVSSPLIPSILAIAAVAFVAGLGREIIKSAEDVKGDVKHRNARTLPAVIGVKNSAFAAAACYIILIPLSFAPFFFGLRPSVLSLGLTAIAALSFAFMAFSAVRNQKKENFASLRKTSFLSLAIGLAGYAASLLVI
jgi:geranylgeranylglycerol-phosphate geranylgeranyltransferase